MENLLHEPLSQYLLGRFYGQPLIANLYRGDYVEGLILFALEKGWKAIGGWGGWDLEREDGIRLEVKQSAALQSWHAAASAGKTSPARFDIAPRGGYYTDSTDAGVWREVDTPVRSADIYIFAWHPVDDPNTVDHRQSEQWQFFVVPEHRLPGQKSIGLNPLKKLAASVTYAELAARVTEVADGIPRGELKTDQLR